MIFLRDVGYEILQFCVTRNRLEQKTTRGSEGRNLCSLFFASSVVVGTVTTKLYSRRSSRKNPLVISTCQFYKFDAWAVMSVRLPHTAAAGVASYVKTHKQKRESLEAKGNREKKDPVFSHF